MTAIAEPAAVERTRWLASAAQWRYGVCAGCGRDRDDDDRPLMVARPERGRSFKCFPCTYPTKRRRTVTTTKTAAAAAPVQRLRLTELQASPDNRDVGDVSELAQSIKSQGLLQPILAVQENGHYLIIAGARRAAAAKKAGLEEVDVIVREFTDVERLLAMAIENLQREDLTALQEAELYRRLTADSGLSQRDLAAKVGKSQGHISKRLALLELPAEVAAQVDSGGITLADAVELARLADHPDRLAAAASDRRGWLSTGDKVDEQLAEIELEKKLVAREEKLESSAVATVRVKSVYQLPKGVHRLQGAGSDWQALLVAPATHASEPCHAIALATRNGEILEYPVCIDRSNHPKVKTRQEKDRAARGSSSSRNDRDEAAANQAATARVAFIGELLGRKGFPKAELTRILVEGYIERAIEIGEENVTLAAVALGLTPLDDDGTIGADVDVLALLQAHFAIGEPERLRLAAALVLTESECFDVSRGFGWSDKGVAYVRYLEQHGYQPTDYERTRLPKPDKKAAAAA